MLEEYQIYTATCAAVLLADELEGNRKIRSRQHRLDQASWLYWHTTYLPHRIALRVSSDLLPPQPTSASTTDLKNVEKFKFQNVHFTPNLLFCF